MMDISVGRKWTWLVRHKHLDWWGEGFACKTNGKGIGYFGPESA